VLVGGLFGQVVADPDRVAPTYVHGTRWAARAWTWEDVSVRMINSPSHGLLKAGISPWRDSAGGPWRPGS
jgi:hypothetical protein